MKIAILQDYLRCGGTEQQTVFLANSFAAKGSDCSLLTFRPGGLLERQLGTGVRRLSLQRRDWQIDWWAPGLAATLQRERFDAVLLMGRMANCYGWLVQKTLPQAAVLSTVRTGKPLPFLFRWSMRRTTATVANSREAGSRAAREAGLPTERIRVIYNSMLKPLDAADRREDVRAAYGADRQTTVFLCVAMFRPEKNHGGLLQRFALIPPDRPWQLWLAGSGATETAAREEARRLGIDQRVRFLGLQADPAPLYAAADAAVLASRRESLPNFLVEAQWNGLPVVACEVGGVAECFESGASGVLVSPEDEEGFARSLLKMIDEPATRTAMGHAGKERARRLFDPGAQAQRYLDLFAELAS
jgi:glycosyltransferase involved in cell wall biosynthesis